ncbi:MAG: NAD(P)-dependent alcohol dehydrogenase [Anaerolineaceae bacterium]|nr:NAD(P)-dependent alcohol dehydrogenase [Anaerolineaceae bacterium]
MKAIIYTEYGSPDVLRLVDMEKPTPKANEVLVKVHAASANPLDWHLMRGEPFLARLDNGLRKPKNSRLGADLAGVVESVGSEVRQFQPGDAVFGENFQGGLGSFAEYVTVPESVLAHKPNNLSFESAAAIPVAAYTALQGMRNKGQIRAGQKVLVNGASGGVGTFAVQIAKALGTEVTGVCSTRNLDLVRSLGADHVVDYTQDDFTRSRQKYDLIFDAVGNRSVAELRRALAPGGIAAIAGFINLRLVFGHMLIGPLTSKFSDKTVGMMETAHSDKDDLLFIKELVEAGQVKPVIDRCYELAEVAGAIRYLETSRARGKVAITIA